MTKQIGTVDDLAEMLLIDRQRAYQLTREGFFDDKGIVIRLGQRQYRYNLAALEKWIAQDGSPEEQKGER